MTAYRASIGSAYFTAGAGAFSSASTSINLTTGDKDIVRRGYDALSHLWELLRAGWTATPAAKTDPALPALLEYAYSERLKMVAAYPSLASVLTMELAAKAAYIVMAGIKLNSRSLARLSRLAESADNWDGEGAKAMSLSSLINFVQFLERSTKTPKEMNIYLGFYGEIVTSWSLQDGSTLDMSFGAHKIELATDLHDEVFSIGDSGLYRLISEL